jgi:hypothetical protein
VEERFRDSTWDRHGVIETMLREVTIPRFVRVSQNFDPTNIGDISRAIAAEFAKPFVDSSIKEGMRVAITVGSRGLANIPQITRDVVEEVKKRGGKPFVVPAMGSHGGATDAGQKQLLEGMGVTESYIGAPILSSMQTIVVGKTEDGKPVHVDKHAGEADGIVVMGRVKPHSSFRSDIESGLMKMMAIGLGKQKGAETVHAEGFGRIAHYIPAFGRIILEKSPVIFGLAIVENSFDDTYKIEAVAPDAFEKEEPRLLKEAFALMPRIKLDQFDVLIVDKIGKNYSGDGMDPNISGAFATPYASGGPKVQRYVVLDLTDESHGNMLGAGLADFVTKRLFDKTDFDAAYPNALTSRVPKPAKMGLVMKNDRTAIKAGIYNSEGITDRLPTLVRIPNTSHINELLVSETLLEQVEAHPELTVLGEPFELKFDANGNLPELGD